MKNQVLWIGNHARSEFARITDALTQEANISFADVARDVETIPSKTPHPQLVCIAVARPGEFDTRTQQLAERLQLRFPTSQIRIVLGELCCGMMRTCDELSKWTALYVHEVPDSNVVSWLVDRDDKVGRDGEFLPTTVTEPAPNTGPLVVVYSRTKSYRNAIAESLAALGLRTIELSPHDRPTIQGASFVVWEVEDGVDELPNVRWISARHPGAEIVALMSYPREYELAHFASQGVRVLSQPYRLSNLFSIFCPTAKFPATSAA